MQFQRGITKNVVVLIVAKEIGNVHGFHANEIGRRVIKRFVVNGFRVERISPRRFEIKRIGQNQICRNTDGPCNGNEFRLHNPRFVFARSITRWKRIPDFPVCTLCRPIVQVVSRTRRIIFQVQTLDGRVYVISYRTDEIGTQFARIFDENSRC